MIARSREVRAIQGCIMETIRHECRQKHPSSVLNHPKDEQSVVLGDLPI
jgi:hypothetical protein